MVLPDDRRCDRSRRAMAVLLLPGVRPMRLARSADARSTPGRGDFKLDPVSVVPTLFAQRPVRPARNADGQAALKKVSHPACGLMFRVSERSQGVIDAGVVRVSNREHIRTQRSRHWRDQRERAHIVSPVPDRPDHRQAQRRHGARNSDKQQRPVMWSTENLAIRAAWPYIFGNIVRVAYAYQEDRARHGSRAIAAQATACRERQ